MRSIALIGGSGFVGTRFIDLFKNKYSIAIFDRAKSQKYPDITTILDIRDKDLLKRNLKGFDIVVLLAAEHRDDISPVSLYYDVNVEGTKNVLDAMDANGVNSIIFTSSVAVYGLNKANPDEEHEADPFNHYGKSKWQAEEVLREWYNAEPNEKALTIIRPTVIFGERNRGNVYNLLKQITSGKFVKIGKCVNKKSMSYVGNVVAFIDFLVQKSINNPDYNLYNYIDKPDLTMNQLISLVSNSVNRKISSTYIPYSIGLLGGYCFDIISFITRKKFPISSVRVKKFCATTQFDASKAHASGFGAPYTLEEGLMQTLNFEFIDKQRDNIVYISE